MTVLLSIYEVTLPESILHQIDHLVIIGDANNEDVLDYPELRSRTQQCINDKTCLYVRTTVLLSDLESLFRAIQEYLEPIMPFKNLWVGLWNCEVFIEYHGAIALQYEHISDPLLRLQSTFRETRELLLRLLSSITITYGEITVNDHLNLEKLQGDVGRDFETIKCLIDYDEESSSECLVGIKAMVSLFQAKPIIKKIYDACQQLQITGCLEDKSLKTLKKIHDELNTEEGKRNLTAEQALNDISVVNHSLQLEELKNHVALFEEVSKCSNFHRFVEEQFFFGERSLSAAEDSFRAWHQIISTQLQNLEYEEEVLRELSRAFSCIVPFMDKNQNLDDLISKVLKLNTSNSFLELQTVSSNMHHIQRWSSQAEVTIISMSCNSSVNNLDPCLGSYSIVFA